MEWRQYDDKPKTSAKAIQANTCLVGMQYNHKPKKSCKNVGEYVNKLRDSRRNPKQISCVLGRRGEGRGRKGPSRAQVTLCLAGESSPKLFLSPSRRRGAGRGRKGPSRAQVTLCLAGESSPKLFTNPSKTFKNLPKTMFFRYLYFTVFFTSIPSPCCDLQSPKTCWKTEDEIQKQWFYVSKTMFFILFHDLLTNFVPNRSQIPPKKLLETILGPCPRTNRFWRLRSAKMVRKWMPKWSQNEAKIKKNIVEKHNDFGRVFFMDVGDFRANFGSLFEYFLPKNKKTKKLQNTVFYYGFEGFSMQTSSKIPSKIRPRKGTPRK